MQPMNDEPDIGVLLIEDNPGDVRLVQEALSDNGIPFEVDVAGRLAEGVGLFDPGFHRVVLLDLGLPDSQGLATFEAVQERMGGSVPVVILSVTGDEEMAVRAVTMGAQDYLVKDEMSPGALARAIRYAIERQRAIDSLSQLTQDLQTFIGQLAHDLQSPITTVAGMAETLELAGTELPEPQLTKLVAAVRRQSDRMSGLVTNLLDLLKIHETSEPERIDLATVVRQVVDDVPRPDGVAVDVRIDALPDAAASQARVERAVTNLLTNAYRYGGSNVRVAAAHVGDMLELTVEDDGPGIPEEFIERMYEPFAQGPNSVPHGSGLGLAIVHRLATGFDGEVLYDRDGELGGARFRLTVPVWSDDD